MLTQKIKSSLYLLHTTSKRATSLGAHLSVIVAYQQHSSFRKTVAAAVSCLHAVSDLTGPRFKPRTFRSRDNRVTARPTGQLLLQTFKNSRMRTPAKSRLVFVTQ